MRKIIFLAAAIQLLIGSLHATLLDFDIDFTAGTRRDKLSAMIDTFDPAPANTNLTHGNLVSSDHFKTSTATLYQIGMKSRWCPWNFIFYVEGNLAWSNRTKFNEVITSTTGTSNIIESSFRNCHARDFTSGAGYLFPICPGISLGPLVGWSFHDQRFYTQHPFLKKIGKIEEIRQIGEIVEVPDLFKHHLKYTNRWQGPWFGLDLALRFLCFDFHAGYRYHWDNWHATWELAGSDVLRKACARRPHAQGQALYVDGQWNFWPFNVGMSLKYYDFQATRGFDQTVGNIGSTNPADLQVVKVKHASWRALVATFNVGLTF